MKNIIDPIDLDLLKSELTKEKFVRNTTSGNNSIFMIDAHNAPNTMLEIGRLRELTFRAAGGGTGEEVDIDEYDTSEVPFKQLIVWSNNANEIISAYRFVIGKDVPLDQNGYPHTPSSKLFYFSEKFIQNQWQECIELGRSFVQPKYQASNNFRESLFALDNIWDGLGALIVNNPSAKYFFGKMTMYNQYNRIARNMILNYLANHFQGDPELVHPFKTVETERGIDSIKQVFSNSGNSIKEDFKILNQNIRDLKVSIPPLIKTYISLTSTMQYFGVSPNDEFGPVEEICILIKIADIYENKKIRHVYSYH